MATPVTIVVFGSTGDLMRRKLVPALLELRKQGILNEQCLIVGIGRRPFSDEEFRAFLTEALDEEQHATLSALPLKYVMGDISAPEGLTGLRAFIEQYEQQACAGRLFYLATNYTFFPTIVAALAHEGLHELRCGWTRLAFEKPFGKDFTSAGVLESGIHKVFPEDAVFRVDHYLAKEGAHLLCAAKESCAALRKILSRAYVANIEIIADEGIGIEERFAYYHEAGALKDMVQSHLLQLLALVLSEPTPWSAEAMHAQRLRVLRSLKVSAAREHLLGQYQSYAAEAGKHNLTQSTVETYARIVLRSTLPSWQGVPLNLRTGKKLPAKRTELCITFRASEGAAASLHVLLHPRPELLFVIEGSVPAALTSAAEEVAAFARAQPREALVDDSYAFLLERMIAGDARWFVRQQEIEACWLLVEELERMRSSIPFKPYADGSDPEGRGNISMD